MARAASEQPDGGGDRFVWPPSEAEWPSFFHYWRGVILRVCASRKLDPETAEDVVQHVMTALAGLARRSEGDFPNISALGGYMTVAATRQIDRVRAKARRQQPVVADDAVPDHRLRDRFIAELVDLIPSDVPAAERFGWLVQQVSEQNRELFRLKYGQGMEWKALSERLGIPLTTLFGRHKAELDALRRRLDRDAT